MLLFYKNIFKPTLDFLLALIGLIILSPLLLVVTLLLSIANHGKPFFIQPRPGKNTHVFHIIKFKTMNDKRDANGNLLSDAARLYTQVIECSRNALLLDQTHYPVK